MKKPNRVSLTDRTVNSLKALPTRQIDYWDTRVRGLSVRVAPSGRKTWTVLYRFNRRVRRLTLGTFPTVGLAKARDLAKDALNSVRNGHDPAADKTAARTAKTFAELTVEYMTRHAKPHKKSWRHDQQMIDQELLPAWRHSKPADITRSDVRALVERIAERNAPIHANRMLALIRKIFNFAIERDWLQHNPCHMVKRPGRETPRDRVLTEEEIRKVWTALEHEAPPIRATLRLQLLTAQRKSEVLSMRWENVDLAAGWWTIPASDAKNGLSHRVPLSSQSIDILTALYAWSEQRRQDVNVGRAKKRLEPTKRSDWVFASPRADESVAWIYKATQRIRESCGVDFTPHDLRRTAASLMTGMGTPRLVVSKILNHAEPGVTAVYDRHSYDGEKRKALDAWDRRLTAILEANDNERASNVVPIDRSA